MFHQVPKVENTDLLREYRKPTAKDTFLEEKIYKNSKQ